MPANPIASTEHVEAYVVACLAVGNWERALEVIEELGPSSAYAPHLAACATRMLAARDPAAARWLADRAVELDPGSAAAHRALGAAAGDPARAAQALQRAVELDPADLSSRLALADLLLRLERGREARPHVEAALALAPAAPEGRELLKRLRKALDRELPPGDPICEELRRLAARLYQAPAPAAGPARVSLCLITRNEAANLPRVLKSVRGLVTETIVVDTGSTDDTVRLARRHGARVEHFTWVDDFAAARNHSLSFATGEWVLVLDADDELAPGVAASLAAYLQRDPQADVVGLYRRYPHPEMQQESVSIQPRLFRNGRAFRFAGRIHEQVVDEAGEPVRPDVTLPLSILHHGWAPGSQAVAERRDRNERLLRRGVEADPSDLRLRFYLGITLYEAREWAEAVEVLGRVAAECGPQHDFRAKAHACRANSLLKLHRPLEAEAAAREGLAACPEHPELWFCLGLVLTSLGRLREGAAAHEAALRGRFGPSLNWHDWACRETKPRLALCDLYLSLLEPEKARRHLEEARRLAGERPLYTQVAEAIRATEREIAEREAARRRERAELESRFRAGELLAGVRLAETLQKDGDGGSADSLLAAWAAACPGEPLVEIARARVALLRGAARDALALSRALREANPRCGEAWETEAAACEALGLDEEAERALVALRELDCGTDADRALGDLYLREERWSDAARSYRASLARRDDLWPTWLGLGRALLHTGELPVAVNCFQRAATLSGGNAAVRTALGEARAYLTSARKS